MKEAFRKFFGLAQPSGKVSKEPKHLSSISECLLWLNGIPQLQGTIVFERLQALDAIERQEAGIDFQRQWLAELRNVLGLRYTIVEGESCLLLSCLPDTRARSICNFVSRIERLLIDTLAGLEQPEAYGKNVVLILSDSDAYYHYLGSVEEDGHFPMSSATYINDDCAHFVTHEGEIASIEAIIVHELTHDMLSHLHLPLWLGEGIASCMEYSFAPGNGFDVKDSPKHLSYWRTVGIDRFWDGTSFLGDAEETAASEVLSLILVKHMIESEKEFVEFLKRCEGLDGDKIKEVAAEYLNLSLDEMVRTLVNF